MPRIRAIKLSCDQCQMLSINGVACHETGCPNAGARYDAAAGQWIKQAVCSTCGYTVDRDFLADCCALTAEDDGGTRCY